jgi:hypothetical protein
MGEPDALNFVTTLYAGMRGVAEDSAPGDIAATPKNERRSMHRMLPRRAILLINEKSSSGGGTLHRKYKRGNPAGTPVDAVLKKGLQFN